MSKEFMPIRNDMDTLGQPSEPLLQPEGEANTASNTELDDYLAWEADHKAWLEEQNDKMKAAQELNISAEEVYRLGIDFNDLLWSDMLRVTLDRGRIDAAKRLNLPLDTSWDEISRINNLNSNEECRQKEVEKLGLRKNAGWLEITDAQDKLRQNRLQR